MCRGGRGMLQAGWLLAWGCDGGEDLKWEEGGSK